MESSISAPPAGLGLVSRIWGTFVTPRRVFEGLRERPRILGALVILVVLNLVVGYLITPYTIDTQLEAMTKRGAEVTDQTRATMEGTMKVTVPIFSALGSVAVVFALAGVYLFLANILLGGAAGYKRMVAAVAHIGFVAIPASVVKVPLMLAQGKLDVQTSLAALLPGDGEKGFLYHLLARTDLFELWMWGLGIVAVSAMAGVTTKKATQGVAGAWIVLSLILVVAGTLIPGMGG